MSEYLKENAMLEYNVTAHLQKGGLAKATANQTEISFDATSGSDAVLPNPAELLLTSLAACILKNTERYSEILKIPYSKARIAVNGKRNDIPPEMYEISYKLEIDSEEDMHKIDLLHRNILKFGTITNTLIKACKLEGIIIKSKW